MTWKAIVKSKFLLMRTPLFVLGAGSSSEKRSTCKCGSVLEGSGSNPSLLPESWNKIGEVCLEGTLLDMVLESVEELRRGDLKILNLEFQRNH
jgi:hypothetical protein